jgi:hypothetical protein
MAGRKGSNPRPLVLAQTPSVDDPKTQRAIDVLDAAVKDLQSRGLFGLFSATEPGYVPASGGSTTDFLAADGEWKTLTGAGLVDSVTAGSSAVTASPTTGAVVIDVVEANFSGIPMSGITFAGTNNRLAKFSGTTIADTTITDTGSLVTVASPINVTGAADFDSSLLVNGTLTVNGAADLDSTLNVDGAATFVSTVSIQGNATIGNAAGDAHTVNGTVDFNHAVNVDGTLTLSTMTLGSVLFAGTGGLVNQDNANFFWDDTNNRLGIGTTGPAEHLHISRSASGGAGLRVQHTTASPFSNAAYVEAQDGDGRRLRIQANGAASNPFVGTVTNHDVDITVNNAITGTFTATRLGLGTTGPTHRLHAVTSDTGKSVLMLQNTHASGFSSVAFQSNAGTDRMTFGSDNASSRNFLALLGWPLAWTDGTTVLGTLFTNGRVNIGATTSDPGVLLRVQGAATVTGAGIFNSTLSVEGNATLGDAPGTDSHTINGNVAHASTLQTGNAALETTYNGSSSTVSFRSALRGVNSATYATAGGALEARAVSAICTASRASGGNSLTNVGLLATAANAQVNIAVQTDAGSNYLNASSGDTGIGVAAGGTLSAKLHVSGAALVTGLSTLTGGFTLGAASSAGSFKITSLADGSSAQDAAAFGQIATAVNAAVSGTANTLAKFTATNVVGNSSITDTGALVTVTNPLTVTGAGIFNSTLQVDGNTVLGNNSADLVTITGRGTLTDTPTASTGTRFVWNMTAQGTYDTTASALGAWAGVFSSTATRSAGANDLTNIGVYSTASGAQVNYSGYFDSGLFLVNGAATFASTLAVNGNATLGNATTDAHTINGGVTIAAPVSGNALLVNNANTGQTASGTSVAGWQAGTYNTTAGALTAVGVDAESFSTRSAGANDLTLIGLYVGAGGGQVNYAILSDYGDNLFNGVSTFNALVTATAGIASTSASATALSGTFNGTAQTANRIGLYGLNVGTYDCSAAGRTAYGLVGDAQGSRSGGAFDHTNIGVYAGASGGQVNWGLYVAAGNAYVAENLQVDGNATICNAAGDTLKFHGGTGSTQQTVTGSRGGNAALADLLTKLATLGIIVDGTSP